MDELDRGILELLRADARRPIADVARELDVARATVHQRLDRLKEAGVVTGSTIEVDPTALGYPLRAFILVGWQADRDRDQRQVAERIANIPGVDRVHIVTGAHDFLVEALGEDMDEVGRMIIERMRAIEGVGDTETILTFWTFDGPGLPLDRVVDA